MPRTKSAKKALRQNLRRRARNLERKKKLASVLKKFKKLVAAKNGEEARAFLPQVYKQLDKLAKVGFIKKNKAARLKSRLAKKLQKP
jgi:small subunit ribosomal protein S20